jgi:hypothetical protein
VLNLPGAFVLPFSADSRVASRVGAVMAAGLLALGSSVATIGTAVAAFRADAMDFPLMDEGLSGLDWTGRGAVPWIVGAMLSVAVLLGRGLQSTRLQRVQLVGVLLESVYWSLASALHVLGD